MPGNKKPRSRAGQGSFQNTRPFSAFLTWRASRSAQITTITRFLPRLYGPVKPVRGLFD